VDEENEPATRCALVRIETVTQQEVSIAVRVYVSGRGRVDYARTQPVLRRLGDTDLPRSSKLLAKDHFAGDSWLPMDQVRHPSEPLGSRGVLFQGLKKNLSEAICIDITHGPGAIDTIGDVQSVGPRSAKLTQLGYIDALLGQETTR
jgi:hypothetical protein